ncbi:MAG: helix-turn-helix domain-containing protein [Nitrospirae bacterium]|nr:MAG: helix-turn-helix domain-containing protein [Nitrospirota bacterium]
MPGEILRKRREESGQDLKKIAHTLKIRYDYLKAIEDEEFEKLPVEVYVKGYIRDYAKFLKIDPEIILKAYSLKTSPPVPEKTPPVASAIKTKKTAIKYFPVVIIFLAIAVAYILSSLNSTPKKQIIAPTEKPAPTVQQAQPVQEKEKTPEVAVKEGKTMPPSPQKSEGKPGEEHTLEISVTDTTWLLMKIDDAESKDMLLNPGESLKFSAKQGFSLKIGNAGGIRLIFDGKDMGIPGEKDKVLNLNLPADKTANPETPRSE